ncbi:fluoride efflux transporter CrcB [Pseudogracilibacillus sp. SE30717A]|uniref:fluoride efflux transporter CrcB n=1 Tax=Pseudogracilibacillus sp. SE30717A TaxID=3098293 RepID=UPI00300E1930
MVFHLLLVAIGGFLGSMLRFWIANKLNKHFIGTWIANVSGSILLAIILKLFLVHSLSEEVWLAIGVGFCGAYTTFSTFGSETIQLIQAEKFRTATYYVVSSFVVSIIIVGIILSF